MSNIKKKRDWIDWTVIMMAAIAFIISILTVIYVDGGAINKGLPISWIDILFSAILAGLVYCWGLLIKKLVNRETKKAFEENQASTIKKLDNLEDQMNKIDETSQPKEIEVIQRDDFIKTLKELHYKQTELCRGIQSDNDKHIDSTVTEINKLIKKLEL